MTYKIIVKPEAEKELFEAVKWYENEREGLGIELFDEITEVFDTVKQNPEIFQVRYKNIRISFTGRFRYGIHYTIEKNVIYVHAILHTSRKPKK